MENRHGGANCIHLRCQPPLQVRKLNEPCELWGGGMFQLGPSSALIRVPSVLYLFFYDHMNATLQPRLSVCRSIGQSFGLVDTSVDHTFLLLTDSLSNTVLPRPKCLVSQFNCSSCPPTRDLAVYLALFFRCDKAPL